MSLITNLSNTSFKGLKVNNQLAFGFFKNGQWVAVGPLVCRMSYNTSSGNPQFYVKWKDGATTCLVEVYDQITSETPLQSLTISRTDLSTSQQAFSWSLPNNSDVFIVKIYDGIKQIAFKDGYETTNSKGNTVYVNTSGGLRSVEAIGQFLEYAPAVWGLISGSGQPVLPESPGMFYPAQIKNHYLPLERDGLFNEAFAWQFDLLNRADTGIQNLSFPAHWESMGYTPEDTVPEGFGWLRPFLTDYDSIKFQKPRESLITKIGFERVNYGFRVKKSGVTILPKNLQYITSSSANDTQFSMFSEGLPGAVLTVCVYWDRQGYICGDSTKPVRGYDRLYIPQTIEGYTEPPIIKYWGEWSEDEYAEYM